MSSVLNAKEMTIIPTIANEMNQSRGITTQTTTHPISKPEVIALIATQVVMEIAMCYISTGVIFWMCKKKTSCCFGNLSGKLKVLKAAVFLSVLQQLTSPLKSKSCDFHRAQSVANGNKHYLVKKCFI